MIPAKRQIVTEGSYFERLLAYGRKPDPCLISYAEDMENWSVLRQEQEDQKTRALLEVGKTGQSVS